MFFTAYDDFPITFFKLKHLDADEEILASVMGAYETEIMGNDSVRNGVFLATNRRLVFFAKKLTGFDFESFPYDKISSLEAGKNLMGKKVTFFASGNKAAMKWINDGDVDAELDVEQYRGGDGVLVRHGDGGGGGDGGDGDDYRHV